MYSVNNRNQLVFNNSVVVPGVFELGEDQRLRYRMISVPEELKISGIEFPDNSIEFKGVWSLDSRHRLHYRIAESEDELILRASFADQKAYRLVFSVTTPDPSGNQATRLFQFEGRWDADAKNRIQFLLSYRDSNLGRFVFVGGWKAGKNHEIVYRFTEEELKSGRKRVQTIIFRGVWQISERGYLNYLVEGKSDSSLRFRAEFVGMGKVRGKRSELVFRIGIEIEGKVRPLREIVRIYGEWRVAGPLELGFEVVYASGQPDEIKLKAAYEFVGRGKIDLELFNESGEGLGIQITVLTKIFGDKADLFLRARATEKEQSAEGGVKIKW